jgi:diguanylate cyclase (GGDEF)-like protein/PAS domain S-box-containing protein
MDERTLDNIVERRVVTCSRHHTLRDATRMMHQRHCSSIIITQDNKPIGIWTEADALKVNIHESRIFDYEIERFMSTKIYTINVELSLNDATIALKRHNVRHLVVINDDTQLVGIISQSDIVIHQDATMFLSMTQVQTILPDRRQLEFNVSGSLTDAIQYMGKHLCDALVVVDNNKPIGLLTERDVVRLMALGQLNIPLIDAISKPLITVPRAMSLLSIRSFMEKRHIRHLGVDDDNGQLIGIISFSDILNRIEQSYVMRLRTALATSEATLKEKEFNLHMAHALIEASDDGIMVADENSIIQSINPAFSILTGYTEEEVIGQPAKIISSGQHSKAFYDAMWATIDQHGRWQGEIWNRRKNGEVYPEWLTITRIKEPVNKTVLYAGIFNDITERKNSESMIEHLAYYDPLTKLPNRQLFYDRLDASLLKAHAHQTQLAVLFIDLDHFKRVNDSLGHSVGDKVLCLVADIFSQCLSEVDTVARIGGDELVVLLNDVTEQADVYRVAQRLVSSLNVPLNIDSRELTMTTSVGCAIFPQDGGSREELLKHADSAMYRAKTEGRNRFCLFSAQMNAQSQQQLALEDRLSKALIKKEFTLVYQPKVNAKSYTIESVEALIRWNDSVVGNISPSVFIPLAEELGLIEEIGHWVLLEAMKQGRQWQNEHDISLHISVNVSAKQLVTDELVGQIINGLKNTQFDAELLDIEVTETSVLTNIDMMMSCLTAIRDLGVSVSMDDFGTGYSSLSMLTKMPLDFLKIDSSFMEGIPGKVDNQELISTIVVMAHNLHLQVVAEGVETVEQLQFLQDLGCEYIQGFYFSKPVVPSDIVKLVKASHEISHEH